MSENDETRKAKEQGMQEGNPPQQQTPPPGGGEEKGDSEPDPSTGEKD